MKTERYDLLLKIRSQSANKEHKQEKVNIVKKRQQTSLEIFNRTVIPANHFKNRYRNETRSKVVAFLSGHKNLLKMFPKLEPITSSVYQQTFTTRFNFSTARTRNLLCRLNT